MANFWDRILPGANRAETQNMQSAIRELSTMVGSLSQLPRTNLAEMLDSRTLALVLSHLNDVQLGISDTGSGEPDNDQRLASVRQCRSQFFYDPLLKRIINLWTDFGFGLNFALTASDPAAQAVWDEFLLAKRNRKVIGDKRRHVLSNRLLVDGEFLFLHFVAEKGGLVTTRMLMTDEVAAILTVPGDPYIPLYYMREWSPGGGMTTEKWLYRDTDATPEDLDLLTIPSGTYVMADDKRDGVIIRAMPMEFPTLGLRGWPLMTAGADWTLGYKKFAEDRAAISAAAAMYYRKIKAKSGSRGVDMVKSKITSTLARLGYENNPPAVAGSTLLLNDMVDEETMPLHTGAQDADKDGAMLMGMAGIAAGVFPHWMGRGESFRLATASSMEAPMYRQWARYQALWKTSWKEMFNFVLDMQEQYGQKKFPDRNVSVNMDPLTEIDLAPFATALVALYNAQLIPAKIAMRLGLNAFGVEDVDTILADEFPEDGQTPAEQAERLKLLQALFTEALESSGDDEGKRLSAEVALEEIDKWLARIREGA